MRVSAWILKIALHLTNGRYWSAAQEIVNPPTEELLEFLKEASPVVATRVGKKLGNIPGIISVGWRLEKVAERFLLTAFSPAADTLVLRAVP